MRISIGTAVLLMLVVWFTWLLISLVQQPVPGINEPHYLGKAWHWWDPGWCRGDFFLESRDVHLVFYQLAGWLVALTSLEFAALLTRAAALGLLASAWVMHCCRLFATTTQMLLVTALLTSLLVLGSWSGEWIIGGVEGKVFSYAALLWAAVLSGRTPCDLSSSNTTADRSLRPLRPAAASRWGLSVAGGFAVAIHPLVGCWGLLAAVFAAQPSLIGKPFRDDHGGGHRLSMRERIALWWGPLLLGSVCAVWGLVPALSLILADPATSSERFAANYLQVFYRLSHHLDPMQFSQRSHVWGGLLGLAWLLLLRCNRQPGRDLLWWRWLTAASLLFAGVGLLVAWGPRPAEAMPGYEWRMRLLRYYPFRLADVLLPLSVSLELGWASTTLPLLRRSGVQIGLTLLLAGLTLNGAARTATQTGPRFASAEDWRIVCDWVREHVPPGEVCHTPGRQVDFKWRAQRPEFVTFKDCPQDARGIVEWNRRLRLTTRFFADHYADKIYTASELAEWRDRTGCRWLISDRLGPIAVTPVLTAGALRVYDLRPLQR